jgi:hypothetical protein
MNNLYKDNTVLFPQCPNCGSFRGVYVNGQARGPCVTYYDVDGQELEVSLDRFHIARSKVVRCENCDQKRNDLIRVGNEIYRTKG